MGRPSKYSQAIADEICQRLLTGKNNGPESLRSICRDDRMPNIATIYVWFEAHKDFYEQYTRAKSIQHDLIAEETFEIADDGSNDWMTDGENAFQLNHEHIQRSRLRLDQRKWYLSKLAPKKYGDKLDVEHSGNLDITVTIGGGK